MANVNTSIIKQPITWIGGSLTVVGVQGFLESFVNGNWLEPAAYGVMALFGAIQAFINEN